MKNKTFKNLLCMGLLLTLCCATATSVYAKESDYTPEDAVEALVVDYDRDDAAGGTILVKRGNEVIYSRGFGMANLEYGVPFTEDTPTNIGSTSKQFTAFAILLLEEEGKLSLEDDIRKYVPELPVFEDTVRLRHLIAHTSGYREFINTLAMGGWRLGDHVAREEVLTVLQRQPELQNTPGEVFNYNNSGYALLSMVVEHITETPFPEWMQTHVFQPLGMEHTLVIERPGQIIPDRAFGYHKGEADQLIGVMDLHASMGAGGIYSTVSDLSRWAANFYDPVIGGEAMMARMQEEFLLNSGTASTYAFGLMITDMHGQQVIHHPGGDMAHRSYFMLFPDIEGLVTVQSNYAGFPGQVAEKVAEAFFHDVMDIEAPSLEEQEDLYLFDPEKFDEIAGRYELEAMPGFVMEFTREGDTLYTQATGQPRFEIHASSDSTFYMTVVDARMTFHRDEDGEVHAMTLHQNGDHYAKRITEPLWEPGAEDLAMYTGRFFSDELEAFYTIVADDEGKLTMQHRRLDDIPLKAESKDNYTGSFPIMSLQFIRDDNDQVTGFDASSGRAAGIFFEKQ